MRYWVSWVESKRGTFEYHGPWWISGETPDDPPRFTMCAAVVADSEEQAREVIAAAHDVHGEGVDDWRFVEPRADDWEPFSFRFRHAPWMKWPWPASSHSSS